MSRPEQPKVSFADRLQAIPKQFIFLLLILAASIPLIVTFPVPNKPDQDAKDFYTKLMQLPAGSKVLIGTDWTNSTRGESKAEFEALIKILIRKKIKFCSYSTGDVQAPNIAREAIAEVSREEGNGQPAIKPYQDYVNAGFFPNSEGETSAINTDVRSAFNGRKDVTDTGPQDILRSPVFEGINSLSDFKMLILVTASGTNDVTLERIKKTPLMFMVTGVMGPANFNYYQTGQLKGLIAGLKGGYDLETLMEQGISDPGEPPVPGFPGLKNKGMGTAYYPALIGTLCLMILMVIIGNVGMFLARWKA
jgi:hypothetical protein